jgi:ADP-heptose:LPS heptosyltransferase
LAGFGKSADWQISKSTNHRISKSNAVLQISNPRERLAVQAADLLLGGVTAATRVFKRRPEIDEAPRRILLLRLERIGDLVMALPAIRDVRSLAPSAQIHLVVGSWNASLARAVPAVDHVETLDARWLSREREGVGLAAIVKRAWEWRPRRYDLAINFEPDVRSNLVLAASGARRTAGWASGGGGPVLDLSLDFDASAHTSSNARRLVAAAFGRHPGESARPLLVVPELAAASAAARLRAGRGGPLVGVQVSGGRAIKQWDPDRFADVAARLADTRGATIVATGGPGDRELVERFRAALVPRPIIDATENEDLILSAALLAELDLLVTGDTGPMHLAAAVGTPVVAVFGPSDPERYATSGPLDRVIRVELPCSPCNRIRRPPARCVGHTPDCLTHVGVDEVFAAALAVLDGRGARLSGAGRR